MKSAFLKSALLAAVTAMALAGGSPSSAEARESARGAVFQTVGHDRHEDGQRDHERSDRRWDRHDDRREGRLEGRLENRGRPERHEAPRWDRGDQNGAHRAVGRWSMGQRLPAAYRLRSRVIPQPSAYHLRRPPRGHQWVRVNGDAVLIAAGTGVIAGIVYGLFH